MRTSKLTLAQRKRIAEINKVKKQKELDLQNRIILGMVVIVLATMLTLILV